jgi:hypothetical protein
MSSVVVLVDTSVFDEILGVPGKSQDRETILAQLESWLDQGASLLLPMATVIETGNHIAKLKGDRLSRKLAETYVEQVRLAMTDQSPFTATPSFDSERVLEWLDEFPDYAMMKIGAADLSIIAEWNRQVALNPRRRVVIWTVDTDLTGYDHSP